MSADADRLDELVANVLDGKPVDWAGAESSALDVEEHLSVTALRDVSRIARFNRDLQRAGRPRPPAGAAASAAIDSPPGLFRWGHLEVLELVGSGSFGQVYRAIDTRLEREVALKLRRVESSPAGDGDSRVLVEARDLAKVRHPNVLVIHGADIHDGQIGFWTDLIRGQTLAAHLAARGPLGAEDVARIGLELCRALGAAHAAGLVHGDVKAANAMVEEGGRIVLMDFGAARPHGEDEPAGSVFGSPLTTAPEILAGAAPTPVTDLYSLGALLYQLASGRPPFVAASWTEFRAQIERGDRPRLEELRPDLPAPLVAAVERALASDPDLRYPSAADMEAALAALIAPPLARRHALPAEPDRLIGREAECAELAERLAGDSRLVTLLGPAGLGKTRLAVHHGWLALANWPGGVWFCDLSDAHGIAGIVSAVAGTLGVPLGKDDPVEQLGRAIAAHGRCLVVLDNFEQVVDLAPATVSRWLEQAAAARFVVTSRERLKVPGEVLQVVAPLAIESAALLFGERARQLAPECDLSGPAADVVRELVELVDRIPLAIELAAARIAVMAPAEILARMRDRFRLLSRGQSTRDGSRGRHSTLEAAIDGSWELLSPWEKAAFAQCAVFQGGFTLEAAEQVLDLAAWPDAPWVVDVVQDLVDKSLLRSWAPARGARAPETRLGMYVSVQEYARARLAELAPGATLRAETRHGQWYARHGTEAALAALDEHGGIERVRRLAMELENLVAACRRAVERGDGKTAVAAFRAASSVLILRGPQATAADLGREVAAMSLVPADHVDALSCLSRAEQGVGDLERAQSNLERALAMSREIGDRRREGMALGSLGRVLQHQGRMDEAQRHFAAAIGIHREMGNQAHELLGLEGLGVQHLLQGRMAEARSFLEAALALARTLGSRAREGTILGNLAIIAAEHGRMDEARSLYEAALAVHRERGNRYGEANELGNVANLLSDQGLLADARVHYETALAIGREIGDRRLEGIVLGNLGTVELEEGAFAPARTHFQAALAIARDTANRRSEGYAHNNLGLLAREENRGEEARAHFEQALAIARDLGNRRMEGITLGGLGALLGDEARFAEARAAFVRGESVLAEVGERGALATLLCMCAEVEERAGERSAAGAAFRRAEILAAEVAATPGSLLRRRVEELRARVGSWIGG